ncbi:hypothetical protein CERSUDRAFT_40391, partial [Gelatoporia subvermispora B]
MLHPDGIVGGPNSEQIEVVLCTPCLSLLGHNKLPALSLVNNTYPGPVPDELAALTPIEKSLITSSRAKCWIIQLKEDKCHVVIHPQQPGDVARVLPPSIKDAMTSIFVVFIGSVLPSKEWLLSKAKPLAVHRERVCAALDWLKQHNPLYRDIEIDQACINALPLNGLLP